MVHEDLSRSIVVNTTVQSLHDRDKFTATSKVLEGVPDIIVNGPNAPAFHHDTE
ncbi:hypothetical protein ACP4OV_013251 [Aristida adscensionis]